MIFSRRARRSAQLSVIVLPPKPTSNVFRMNTCETLSDLFIPKDLCVMVSPLKSTLTKNREEGPRTTWKRLESRREPLYGLSATSVLSVSIPFRPHHAFTLCALDQSQIRLRRRDSDPVGKGHNLLLLPFLQVPYPLTLLFATYENCRVYPLASHSGTLPNVLIFKLSNVPTFQPCRTLDVSQICARIRP
jgi:hypothetical protein